MPLYALILFCLIGFVLLYFGAEWLVKGSSTLARSLGMSPIVIGLTVVAFGTSAPELVVSLISSIQGKSMIAVGNVVGSNICNVLLILGLSALVAPLTVARQVVRLEVPIMIVVSGLLVVFSLNGILSRWEGALLFGGALVYTFWTVRRSRREGPGMAAAEDPPAKSGQPGRAGQALMIVGGLGLLGLGSKWLVDGAVATARFFGVSDLVIGLTVVAVGTSLPELATSVLASIRGQRDIAVGNVVGSNLFNILVVLGLTAVVAPSGIPVPKSALTFDLAVMTVVSFACLPIFFTGHRIDRWEGGLFLGYYLAYLLFIVLTGMEHHKLPMLTQAMIGFVIPLTLVTLAISVVRNFRGKSIDRR